MIAIGFVAAIIVGEYRAKKKGLDSEAIIDLAIIAILTGFLGAKILYILISFREFPNFACLHPNNISGVLAVFYIRIFIKVKVAACCWPWSDPPKDTYI